ncbi:hypothetical protein H0H87_001351 [Tephrocybe sp. NHM501043]|nr:hypothetical protein H0H87_001351 [Tephrocybe sp. NHM501043]
MSESTLEFKIEKGSEAPNAKHSNSETQQRRSESDQTSKESEEDLRRFAALGRFVMENLGQLRQAANLGQLHDLLMSNYSIPGGAHRLSERTLKTAIKIRMTDMMNTYKLKNTIHLATVGKVWKLLRAVRSYFKLDSDINVRSGASSHAAYGRPGHGRNEPDPVEAVRRQQIRMKQYKQEIMQEIEADNQRRRRRALVYSDPPLKHSVELAWPIQEFRVRQMSTEYSGPLKMLFFDISRDPLNLSEGGIRLVEDGHSVPIKVFDQSMSMYFAPNTTFTTIKLKCDDKKLDRWDVTIARPQGIRILDVFEEIYKTYSVPLEPIEQAVLYRLIESEACQDAFLRRCNRAPGAPAENRRKGVYRVDLLGSKTLFNGLIFNGQFCQYHFQLLDRDPRDLCSSNLY